LRYMAAVLRVKRRRGAPGRASGELTSFVPSGAALYARPPGVRAGVSLHRHGTSAVSRRIPKQHAAAREPGTPPVGAGTKYYPPPGVNVCRWRSLAEVTRNDEAKKRYLASSAIAWSARTPLLILIGSHFARAVTSALVIMIWFISLPICGTEAAKTNRPMPHHTIAPMHMTHGSPEV